MSRVLVISMLAVIGIIQAFATSPEDYTSLYSWRPKGQPWHFGFFSESKLPTTRKQIKYAKEVIVGVPALKSRLLQFHRGHNLSWRNDPPAFTYPPAALIEDVQRFAQERGVEVELNPAVYCPSASNHPIDRTADRSAFAVQMTSALPLQATRCFVGGLLSGRTFRKSVRVF